MQRYSENLFLYDTYLIMHDNFTWKQFSDNHFNVYHKFAKLDIMQILRDYKWNFACTLEY